MTTEEERAWLEGLKAGDTVVISSSRSMEENRVVRVTKITPAMVCVGDEKFRKKDGYRHGDGDSWYRAHLVVANGNLVAQIRLARARARMTHVRWSEIPDEIILKIDTLLKGVKA